MTTKIFKSNFKNIAKGNASYKINIYFIHFNNLKF